MNELLKRLGIGALIGLFAGLLISYGSNVESFFLTDLLDGYEFQSYDARMRAGVAGVEEASIDTVVIIDIEQQSTLPVEEGGLGRYFNWPQAYHGQLIDVVTSGEPAALLFDIIFDPENTFNFDLVNALNSDNVPNDEYLSDVTNQFLVSNDPTRFVYSTYESQKAYHALVFEQEDSLNFLYKMDSELEGYDRPDHIIQLPESQAEQLPKADRMGNTFPDLLQASVRTGSANFPQDSDGIIRRSPTAIWFEGLNDNSQGFNNFAAPGADRLKITASLFKKQLDDTDDDNFIELARIVDGSLIGSSSNGGNKASGGSSNGGVYFKDLNDVLAKRTYDESGNYAITPFDVVVLESLNDNVGNQGIFQPGSFTYNGNDASDNLVLYKISPGKAYVKGYELETTEPIFIDVNKPRTSKKIEDQLINYNTGSTFTLNNSTRSPQVGIGNTYVVSLRDSRLEDNKNVPAGNEIGLARVYDFNFESPAYNTNDNINHWGISLFDIQTYTEITLNQAIDLTTPTFVKGSSSGATAFLKNDVSNSPSLVVYDKNGSFIENESLIFDGLPDGRISIAVTEHSISDVKSINGNGNGVGAGVGINTFSADVIQSSGSVIGISTITAGGVIRSNNPSFLNGMKVGSILSYDDARFNDPNYLKVTVVGTDSVTTEIVGIVTGVNNSVLPTALTTTTDLTRLTTKLSNSSDNTLYSAFPKSNISNVDLTNSTLPIRKTYNVNIANNAISASTPVEAGDDEIFSAFTSTGYSLTREDGSIEVLSSSNINISSNGKQFQAHNLTTDIANCKLIATLIKSKPVSKSKIKNRVKSVIFNKSKLSGSGIGATTINDGLTYGNYPYGTRVQDEDICLNTADIINIHGIYESYGITDPSSPLATLGSINSPSGTTSEFILGERLVGEISNAIAIVSATPTSNTLNYIYLNDNTFDEGEIVEAIESGISAVITDLEADSNNISSKYTFTSGQEDRKSVV